MSSLAIAATKTRACNLCGSREARPRYEVDGYRIVDCLECGLCFVADEISSEELIAYYSDGYYNGSRDQGYADYLGNRASRMAYFRTLIRSLSRHLSASEVRLLDVGCAAGYFLEVAQEAGWQARGIEMSPYMSEYARRERGLDVMTGTLDEADLKDSSFNLITMWDVIEHLTDPLGALTRAHHLLEEGGIIAISTGDISGITSRVYGKRWALLAPPGHLFYFSRKTLFAMLRETGFKPLGYESDGAGLVNDRQAAAAGVMRSALYALHRNRLVNAALRRLKLGSIMTVYAQKCGIN